MHWLLTTAARAEHGLTRLVVLAASGSVRDLLAVTGVDQHLVVVGDP